MIPNQVAVVIAMLGVLFCLYRAAKSMQDDQ